MSSSISRHPVVTVGSGFGGLAAAKALRRAPVDVIVIDRTNHHLFQPLLYQMATGVLAEGDIARPTVLPSYPESLRRRAHRDLARGAFDARRLRGDDATRAFRYRGLGTMATVARFWAVAWFGPVRVAGQPRIPGSTPRNVSHRS